jgi:uncharacterized protein YhjY with autotransporter beta-barrel domain
MNMKNLNKKTMLVAASVLYSAQGHAGMAKLIDTFSTELERSSAIAALKTYDDLIANAGCYDSMRGPNSTGASEGFVFTSAAPQAAAIDNASCTGQTYKLFTNVRAIIHTANELTNDGPTEFSLGLDKRGLGLALRWDAAEEYSAQGSLASDYLRGQVSSLGSRLSALRMGAQGFHINAMGGYSGQPGYATNGSSLSGGGAGDAGENFSQWGGFINYAYGDGTKAPTDLEDAFAFDGHQINGGVDYRINNDWIVGGLVSYVGQRVDFDSSKSTVSGNVEASGYSVFPFAMYQHENFYVSASLGYQQLKFDSLRAIHYPSLNPDVQSPDTQTVATTDATNTSFFVGTGYNFAYKNVSVEPFFNINLMKTKIDKFIERDLNNSAFDLVVDDQDITTRNTTLGATLRYTFTPSFGVITPFASYEFVTQNEDKARSIAARYVNAASSVNAFGVPTDAIDKNYNVTTLGISSVLVGAHEKTVGGVVAGGVQAFVQYKQLQNLQNYTVDMIELGLRYEF